ncbi:hypothetical protein NPIL_215881 [Nephila pilipes]|uniref:Uncharacterized protein n=1 Tax=Nephila pilipes TaxID=299642 RepID=A0A8X6NEY1_NEPPI|nr:hypothetical protein NPIL_215881 [Nephila pilipes]
MSCSFSKAAEVQNSVRLYTHRMVVTSSSYYEKAKEATMGFMPPSLTDPPETQQHQSTNHLGQPCVYIASSAHPVAQQKKPSQPWRRKRLMKMRGWFTLLAGTKPDNI